MTFQIWEGERITKYDKYLPHSVNYNGMRILKSQKEKVIKKKMKLTC